MSRRSVQLRLYSLLEILLALGLLTDSLAAFLLSPFSALSNPLTSVVALATLTLLSSFLLTLLITALLRLRGESIQKLYLGGTGVRPSDVLLGLALVPVIFFLTFLLKSALRHFLPGLYSGERNVLEELMHSPLDLVLFLAVALFAGGFREELQRAFVIRRFAAGWGPAWLGASLFALFFGYGHLVQGKDEAIIAGVFGLVWGGVYAARRNAVAPGLSHGLYDALELVRYYAWGPLHYF